MVDGITSRGSLALRAPGSHGSDGGHLIPDAGDAPATSRRSAPRPAAPDLSSYLDARAEVAVAHLDGALPVADLSFIVAELRAEMSSDPVLVELVRRVAHDRR